MHSLKKQGKEDAPLISRADEIVDLLTKKITFSGISSR